MRAELSDAINAFGVEIMSHVWFIEIRLQNVTALYCDGEQRRYYSTEEAALAFCAPLVAVGINARPRRSVYVKGYLGY